MGLEFLFGNKQAEEGLTKVYKREVIVEYVNFLVAGNVPFSLALIDIDNFKYVNDTYGHVAGDKVLQEVADRIKQAVGDKGTTGRFGGDEFIVVFPDLVAYDEIWKKCRDIMTVMNGCEIHQFSGLYVTVTIGLARFPENEKTYEGLLDTADKALYRGKTKGRNCFIIYLPEKHGNIELKTEKDKSLSSMYLHSMVFRLLTKNPAAEEGIRNLFNFLSSYFMIDRLCIQKGEKILFEKTHSLSKCSEYSPIDIKKIKNNMSISNEIFYFNFIDSLTSSSQMQLAEQYTMQMVRAGFCCEIADPEEKEIIMLRAESTSKRVWQYGEMDIYITAAKVIEMLLAEGKVKL